MTRVLDRCPECGYSLEGLPAAHACPECGLRYDELSCVHVQRTEPVKIGLTVVLAGICLGYETLNTVKMGDIGSGFGCLSVLYVFVLAEIARMIWWPVSRTGLLPDGISFAKGRRKPRLIPWSQVTGVDAGMRGNPRVVAKLAGGSSIELMSRFWNRTETDAFAERVRACMDRYKSVLDGEDHPAHGEADA